MEAFKIMYTMLGGLGIFFYGMKSMSEALQSVAGEVIKNAIATITKNRVYSVIVGVVVTMLVQSSSVTTVMIVGLVNAGLMNLTQAIGVIFGANIGTTITGWIISIKVGKYGLLLIGLGIFPMLFGNSNKFRQIGKILFGIGMIFFGLSVMSGAFRPLRNMPEFLNMISYFNGGHYGSYAACIVVGCILTMVIQSSSAMLGITIALATTGVIQFHTAAALVLGENIGTTITALLACVGGNIHAKRAAKAHAIFNMLGVIVVFSIFPVYIQFIDWLVPGNPLEVNSSGDFINIAVHIATGHSVFNVTAAVLFIPFLNKLANLVIKITPDKDQKEQHHLVMLGEPKDMVPATALTMAHAEISKLKEVVDRMYELTSTLFENNKKINREKMIAKASDYEKITDNIQKEITIFVLKLMELPLSEQESKQARALMIAADELESIADYLWKLIYNSSKIPMTEILGKSNTEEFMDFYSEVKEYYQSVSSKIISNTPVDQSIINRNSETLKQRIRSLSVSHLQRMTNGEFTPRAAVVYSDLVAVLRKIRSHTYDLGSSNHV